MSLKTELHDLQERNLAHPGRPVLAQICHDNNKLLNTKVPNVLLILLQASKTDREDLYLLGNYIQQIGHGEQILCIRMNFNRIYFA